MSRSNSRYYASRAPKMPAGLVGLMEELSRDVLRKNPTELYAFCADHMRKLLLTRDGSTPKTFLTLEQKITLATNKVRERATQRYKTYDRKMQELFLNDDCGKTSTKNNGREASLYVQDNILTIAQTDITKNIEHEVSVLIDDDKHISKTIITPYFDAKSAEMDKGKDEPTKLANSKNSSLDKKSEDKEIISSPQNTDKDIKNKSYTDTNKARNIHDLTLNKNKFGNTIIDKIVENNIVLLEQETEEKCNDDITVSVFDVKDAIDDNIHVIDDKSLTKERLVEDKDSHIPLDNLDNFKVDNNEIKIHEKKIEHVDSKTFVDIVNNIENVKSIDIEGQNKINDTENNVEGSKIFHESISDVFNSPSEIEIIINNPKDPRNEYRDIPINVESTNKNKDEQIFTLNPDKELEDDIPKIKYNESHNLNNAGSMDLETAAITIQKVFRSFLFRNKTVSVDDATNVDINLLIEDKDNKDNNDKSNINVNKDRRTLGIGRMDTILQTVNEEKSLSLSTDDSSTLSSAATIIQARVRGFLVRNKVNNNKTTSSTSGIDSDGLSITSLEDDNYNRKNKTILNIHIVPEGGHFMSADESILTSTDLSLDGSPSSSTNLHPLGYDKTERRKQLKREDAIQSISPPSNNSGKLSEDVDSVKEIFINGGNDEQSVAKVETDNNLVDINDVLENRLSNDENIPTMIDCVKTEVEENIKSNDGSSNPKSISMLGEMTSDEMDVITPYSPLDENVSPDSQKKVKLIHSGEFHDVALPTKVSRSDASVVRGE